MVAKSPEAGRRRTCIFTTDWRGRGAQYVHPHIGCAKFAAPGRPRSGMVLRIWCFVQSQPLVRLSDDPVCQVGGLGRDEGLHLVQVEWGSEMVEQWGSRAQQDRRDVKAQLVDEPGSQRLLDDARAAHDVYQLV